MGVRLGDDKIGALSFSTPTVSLGASLLTIGGQQYYTSGLAVTLSGLVANKLYMVYVVISAGVPTLVFSQNYNSVGPSGYNAWKLVGAFWSNNASVFNGNFFPVSAPLSVDASVRGSPQTLNTSITGHLDWATVVDRYGIVTQHAGAYNAATGQFATQNARIYAPIPGTMSFSGEIAWTTSAANFTNTWTGYFYKNGAQVTALSKNGAGSNSGTSLSFMDLRIAFSSIAATGDLYQILASNDLAPYLTQLRSGIWQFRSFSAIQDL